MQTNKELLGKGIKNMMFALLFIISGPTILNFGFKLHNYLTISCGVILIFCAIFFIFRGIHIIMKALFND